jgi:hypothetical protein
MKRGIADNICETKLDMVTRAECSESDFFGKWLCIHDDEDVVG